MDIISISSEALSKSEEVGKIPKYSDEEISEFLKYKPFSAFQYEFYKKYDPERAEQIITDLMNNDNDKDHDNIQSNNSIMNNYRIINTD